jgi:hypothetical protein
LAQKAIVILLFLLLPMKKQAEKGPKGREMKKKKIFRIFFRNLVDDQVFLA